MRYLILILVYFAFEVCAEEITWLSADRAPCYMFNKVGIDGYCDYADRTLKTHLAQYNHRTEPSSLERYQEIMKQDQNFCTTELYWSAERAKYLVYSRPIVANLTGGLIARASDERIKAHLNENGEVRLESLLNSDLTLGLNAGRSFGSHLDQILALRSKDTPVTFVTGNAKVVELLMGSRFDYTLAYPSEIALYELNAHKAKKAMFYPVAGVPPLIDQHVACRDTEFGRRVIADINQILKDIDKKPFAQALANWLPQPVAEYYFALLKLSPGV